MSLADDRIRRRWRQRADGSWEITTSGFIGDEEDNLPGRVSWSMRAREAQLPPREDQDG